MDSNDDVIDEIDVERIAYAAIGRHLRVMCVLALLLLVIGFLMGHHIASQHSRHLTSDFNQRTDLLLERIATLDKDVAGLRSVKSVDSADLKHQATRLEQLIREQDAQMETARRANEEAEQHRRAFVVQCIEQMELDRRSLLRELKPYFEQSRPIAPAEVSEAMTRVVDAQVGRLNKMIDVPAETECPAPGGTTLPLVPTSEHGPSPTVAAEFLAPKPLLQDHEIDLGPPPSSATQEPLTATAPAPPEATPIVNSTPAASPIPAPAPPVETQATPPAPVRHRPIFFSPSRKPEAKTAALEPPALPKTGPTPVDIKLK
jgi:hypothetical protein